MWIKFFCRVVIILWIITPSLYCEWFTNGNVVSQIDFSKLQKDHRITIMDDTTATVFQSLPDDVKDILLKFYTSTNQVLREILSQKISNDASLIELREYLAEQIGVDPRLKSLQSKELISTPLKGNIILKNADLIESSIITIEETIERMVEITGQVIILYEHYIINANRIIINSKTRYVYAEGNVKLEGDASQIHGDKVTLNMDTLQGYIQNPHGFLENLRFRAEQAKLNNKNHITLENSQSTYDTNEEPFFHLDSSRTENYGSERVILDNIVLYIHNHPFFYWPFFMQHPFGTGIEFVLGRTDREGWFFLNHLDFFTPAFKNVAFDFNFYQKLGQYINIENNNSFDLHRYRLKFAAANYYEGYYLDSFGTRYSVFNRDDLNRDAKWRFKLNYSHSMNIASGTSLNWNWNKTWRQEGFDESDPYFTSHLESRTLPPITLGQILRTEDINESRLYPSAGDKEILNFRINQQLGPGSLALSGDWDYGNFRDQSKPEQALDGWKSLLTTVRFPNFVYSLRGIIDPAKAESAPVDPNTNILEPVIPEGQRKFFLNMPYNLGLTYTLTSHYTNAKDLSDSALDWRFNNLSTFGDLNRTFTLDKNHRGEFLKSMSLRYSTGVDIGYQQQWGGEERDDDHVKGQTKVPRICLWVTTKA